MSTDRLHRRLRYFTNNLPDYREENDSLSTSSTHPDDPHPTSSQETTRNVITENVAIPLNVDSDDGTVGDKNPNSVETSQSTDPPPTKINRMDDDPSGSSSDTGKCENPLAQQPKAIVDKDLIKKRLLHLIHWIVEKQKCNCDEENCDGGLYVGISGIAYMFNCLATSTDNLFDSNEKQFFTQQALRFLGPTIDYAASLEKRDGLSSVAYLLGFAGTFAVAALIYSKTGDTVKRDFYVKKYEQIACRCAPIHYLTKGSDELLVGRAGYICGANLLNKFLGDGKLVIPEGVLLALAISSVKSGREYSARNGLKNICPLMYSYYGTDYLGAAHGLSGILQALLTVPGILHKRLDFERDIKKSVDYLLSIQTESGNFPCALDELIESTKGLRIRSEENELVHWCHGAPGVIWLMARAYLIWKEDKYLDCCIKCGELVWSKGLLRKGPGICHGVAGNAYVFLLLHRLTGKPKYLHRANQFQEFLFTDEFRNGSRTPDSPYSMFEGWAGTICFLVDLLKPEKSHFPLYFDPFDDITSLYSNVEPQI